MQTQIVVAEQAAAVIAQADFAGVACFGFQVIQIGVVGVRQEHRIHGVGRAEQVGIGHIGFKTAVKLVGRFQGFAEAVVGFFACAGVF